MKLPTTYQENSDWTFVGPMGPALPDELTTMPQLAVDGGARYARDPDLWVGDTDSLGEVGKAHHVFHLPREKDASDLATALSFFTDARPYRFHLWGFLGGRRDHELFNLGEALRFLAHSPHARFLFYKGAPTPVLEVFPKGSFSVTRHGLFSFAALSEAQVSLQGACRYKLDDQRIHPLSSQGLSNVGDGVIQVQSSVPFLLYYPEAL